MSTYYILTKSGEVFEMDATRGMSNADTGTLTQYKTSSGVTAADHYINEGESITLTGTITDTKGYSSSSRTTLEFLNGIKALKRSAERYTVIWRADAGQATGDGDVVGRLTNCLFENIIVSQDGNKGVTSGKYSYNVTLTITQMRVAKQADIITGAVIFPKGTPAAGQVADGVSLEKSGSGSTQEVRGEEEIAYTELAKDILTGNTIGVLFTLGTGDF